MKSKLQWWIYCGLLSLLVMACAGPQGTTGAPEVGGEVLPEPTPIVAEWQSDPETLVVRATFCCGFVPPPVIASYLPEAQLWGDGRLIWVEQEESGERRVLKGQLSQEEMAALMQQIVDSGFFTWEERYAGEPVSDLPDRCLFVDMAHQAYQVCENNGGAPDAFYDLFDKLSQGAGTTGEAYVPEVGYLSGAELPPDFVITQADLVWPEALSDVSLAEAAQGIWIEGEALQQIWEATHTSLSHLPVVQGEEGAYQFMLQIPGVSRQEPPGSPPTTDQ